MEIIMAPLYLKIILRLSLMFVSVKQMAEGLQKGIRSREYCLGEEFDPSCDVNQVIVMKSAQYGRMELGRCATNLAGRCKTKNVMWIMDGYCSGKRLCEVPVADKKLMETKPCEEPDYTSYLMAEYVCVPVHERTEHICSDYLQDTISVDLSTRASGHIASLYTTPNCRYRVEVRRGQRVKVTVRDFQPHSNTTEKEGSVTGVCQQLVTIIEPIVDVKDTVCRSSERDSYKYMSQTNIVDLELKNTNTAFLIGYHIIGCPSMPVPTGSYVVQQSHDRMLIECNHTRKTFELHCRDGQWEGSTVKCAGMKKGSGNHEKHEDSIALPSLGISMLIIFGVALVIVIYVAGMMVCVMYVRRKRRVKERPAKSIALQGDMQEDMMIPYDKIFTNPREEQLPMLLKSGTLHRQQSSAGLQQCDCTDQPHCQVHGPFSACESPYIVAGQNYKLCPCDSHTSVTSQTGGNGFSAANCCIPANSMPSIDIGEDPNFNNRNSTYQSSRSLKGVRFATINGSEAPLPKPYYLELNSRGLNSVSRDNCPDVLPVDNTDRMEETNLSSFRS